MSGHDDFNHGQDAFLPDASFDPDNSEIAWTAADFLHVNYELYNLDAPMNGNMEIAESNDSILPSGSLLENPTLDGATNSGVGSGNDDDIQTQFSDLPMFASPPPTQTFGAESVYNMPLVNANQASDQPVHATLSTQASYAPPINSSSPINHGFNPYHVMGLINGSTWSPVGADLPTTSQSRYPVPLQQQWSGMQRTQFQQASQALASADAVDSHSTFQLSATGNHFSAPRTQGDLPNVFNGFPHPAGAPARRTLAHKPASDAQATFLVTQESSDIVKPVPPPVVPKKKGTKVKQTAQRKKATTSNAKKTAVKKPIDSSQLLVSTLDEAMTIAIKRIKLKVVDDDRAEVAARPEFWILKIAEALVADYKTQGEDYERLTEERRTEFERWQKEHENKTWAILSAKEEMMSKFAQSCAMILYKKVLEGHQLGLEDPGKAVSNGGADTTMKCSERINAAITAIEEYSIVKYDLLRLDRLEALVASPVGFVKRKVENCLVNFKKKQPSTRIRRSAPEAKSEGKKKRKEPSPLASDDEDEENDKVQGQGDEEFEQPAKRTRRR